MSLYIYRNKQIAEYTTIFGNVDFVHPNITNCKQRKCSGINEFHKNAHVHTNICNFLQFILK